MFIAAWTFLFFLARFWKELAVRGRNFSDCQRNPTMAVNASLNIYFQPNISTFLAKFLKIIAARGRNIRDCPWNPTMAVNGSLNIYFQLNISTFLANILKIMAARGRNIRDCPWNPTTAVIVSLNLYLCLNNFFLAKFLKRIGSAWQNFQWLSKESNHSKDCRFECLSPPEHFLFSWQDFEKSWQCVAEILVIVKGIQPLQWM